MPIPIHYEFNAPQFHKDLGILGSITTKIFLFHYELQIVYKWIFISLVSNIFGCFFFFGYNTLVFVGVAFYVFMDHTVVERSVVEHTVVEHIVVDQAVVEQAIVVQTVVEHTVVEQVLNLFK